MIRIKTKERIFYIAGWWGDGAGDCSGGGGVGGAVVTGGGKFKRVNIR